MRFKIQLIGAFLIMSCLSANAQFGVSARLQNNTNKNWTNTYQTAADTSQSIFPHSIEYGINYWFRLKDYRVEFLPEISYSKSENSELYSGLLVNSHSRTSYNFNFNVQIYPLDFFGDCDCPTFSKDGNFMSKGFYWLLSPGLSMHTIESVMDPLSSYIPEDTKITSVRFGVGAGVDMGLTNMITMSPFIMYSMNFGNNWENQPNTYSLEDPASYDTKANIKQWHFGLRLIFRPDYKS